MTRHNDPKKVREFYDFVSPFFQSFWGEHLHHGYWIHGNESRQAAQIQLIEHLAECARIASESEILDIGCGIGGSSIYLARQYQARVTGITISPIQVQMATQAAAENGANAKFLLMNAEAMKFDQRFDVIWSVESVSHYQNIPRFFASAAKLLKPNGTLAMIDWFRKDGLDQKTYRKHILPIEKGMLVELSTMQDYQRMMKACGLEIAASEVLNRYCHKTWDVGLDIIKNKVLWKLAAKNGVLFVNFLRAFRAMKAGFASGDFVYGLIVARLV